MLRGYLFAIIAAVIAALVAGAYIGGRSDGRAVQAVECAADKAKAEAKALKERQAIQDALNARAAELERAQQEGANAIAQVRVEYLPAKTIVKREVVEKRVFTDCRIGDGMRDTINAALGGKPTATERASEDGVSGGA